MTLRELINLNLFDRFLYKGEPVMVTWRDYVVEVSENGHEIEHFAFAFEENNGRKVSLRSMYPQPDRLDLPDYQPLV